MLINIPHLVDAFQTECYKYEMSAQCPSDIASCSSIGISLIAHKNMLILLAVSMDVTCREPNSYL